MISFLQTRKNFIINFSLLLVSSLVLLWSALNNGYPLVHSDTGAYVDSSFTLKVPLNDRPIGYGLFLLSARLFNSLWYLLFFQSFITALLLFRVAVLILPDIKERGFIAFSIIIATVLTTDISKYVSWLMPDILTSWLFLGGLLFFISTRFTDKLFSVIIIMISFAAHNSHVYLLYFSIILLLFFSWKFYLKNNFFLKKSKRLLLVVLIATLGLCTLNLILSNGFTLTNNNSVFYINKLAYHGVLTKTLDKYCSEKNWKLCAYKETIRSKGNERFPSWYFWGDDSPLQKLGGWEKNPENQDEYQDIILHSLKSFFPMILLSSLRETFKQLISFNSFSGLHKYDEGYAVFRILQRRYPDEFSQFINGKQEIGEKVKVRIFPLDEKITQVFFAVAAIIVLGICISGKHYFLVSVLTASLIFIFLNAIIVGFSIDADGRYMGRVLWLIPYFLFLAVSSIMLRHRNNTLPDLRSQDSNEYNM